jgi:hypothetical protein
MSNELERLWKEAVVFVLRLLSQDSPTGSEEITKLLSGWSVCLSRYEPGVSRIRNGSAVHSITMFFLSRHYGSNDSCTRRESRVVVAQRI